MKKTFFYSLLLVLAVSVSLAATTKEDQEKNTEKKMRKTNNSHYPVTIKTYNHGREPIEVTFEKAPERVVAYKQSAIELMLALGLEDKLVLTFGLDSPIKEEFTETFKKVKFHEGRPSKEEIIDIEPDFIFAWWSFFGKKSYGDVGTWHERGAKTYIWQNSGLQKIDSIEYEYEDILNIGKIFNVEEKAQALVDKMKKEIAAAKKHVEGKQKVRAIMVEGDKKGNFWIYNEKILGGQIAMEVGADLLARDKKSIGREEMIDLNPDVIFSIYYGDHISKDLAVSSIMKDEAFQNISAVKNKRVIPIFFQTVYASGIRTYDGIKTIISGLYPGL